MQRLDSMQGLKQTTRVRRIVKQPCDASESPAPAGLSADNVLLLEPSPGCISLTKLPLHREAVVETLPPVERHLRRLMSYGILPGVRLVVIRRFPAYVIEVGRTWMALDRETASRIGVRPL